VRVIELGDVEIQLREWGQGPPLLLLHGLGMSSELWVHQAAAFGARYRVLALDLRGFGRSSRPEAAGAYAIERMAEDVRRVGDACGLDRHHLLGTSMGGFVALTLALAEPRRCRSLVLCHTGFRMSMPADVLGSRLRALREEPMAAYAALVAEQALAPGAGPELRAWVTDLIARNDPDAYGRVLREGLPAFDVGARVAGIRAPTLVVVGELDRVIPPGEGRELARRIPGARLAELGGVGHLGYAEAPDAFNAAVLGFLAEVDAVNLRDGPRASTC
jgi:pimeloyl-ACP methyl ester carboxylesterase